MQLLSFDCILLLELVSQVQLRTEDSSSILLHNLCQLLEVDSLPHQWPPIESGKPILENGPFVPVDEAQGDFLSPLKGDSQGGLKVGGVILRWQDLASFLVPGVGVELVEGDAWLQHLNKRKPRWAIASRISSAK